jgi:hypothetical protein
LEIIPIITTDYEAPGAGNIDGAENVMQPAPNDGNGQRSFSENAASILMFVNPVSSIPRIFTAIKENAIVWVIKYILTTLINSQQSLVLLPLTNMNTNPYCVVIYTPTNDENAVCLYKYAAYALPQFFIYSLSGCFGYYLTSRCQNLIGNGSNCECMAGLAVCVFTLATAFCAFMAAAYLVYYLFAGIAVGLWFQFGVYYWALQTSRPEFLSISLFIFGEIMWAILRDAK